MTAIWAETATGWELLRPHGFPDEATLHDLIAQAPHVLPLSGNPRLVVLGREVPLGAGHADLIAVESTGRPVVIEVKLAKNPESRRAVIAQVLAYAASLYRGTIDSFTAALAPALSKSGFESIGEAIEANDQEQSTDVMAFTSELSTSLEVGDIRLVLVLDSAPPELISVVGYLSVIAPNLTVDLITISAFQLGDRAVIVPQRIEPGRLEPPPGAKAAPGTAISPTVYSPGSAEFESGIDTAAPDQQPELRRLLGWVKQLERDGVAQLRTGSGVNRWTLVPLVIGGDAGLVTLWNDRGGAAITPWRTAFAKWAPAALSNLDSAGVVIKQGNSLREISASTLALFAEAYAEAARRLTHPNGPPQSTADVGPLEHPT